MHSLQVTGANQRSFTDSSVGHGLLPVGVPEQASPAVPITSEGVTAIKHKLLFFSFPWELTHPAAATAKCSGHFCISA